MQDESNPSVVAVIADPAGEWDQFALKLLLLLCDQQGMTYRVVHCSPSWRADAESPSRLVPAEAARVAVIGVAGNVRSLIKDHAEATGTPCLLLSADQVLPLARPCAGLPSLAESMRTFLASRPLPVSFRRETQTARAAGPQKGQNRWGRLRDALEVDATSAGLAAWRRRVADAVHELRRTRPDPREAFELVAGLCAEPAARGLWKSELSLVGRLVADLPLTAEQRLAAEDRFLEHAAWRAIWGADLRRLGSPNDIIRVEGLENLPTDWRSKGIVFAHWHTPFAPNFWTWLGHEGVEGGIVVGRGRWTTPAAGSDASALPLETAQELEAAQNALKRGRHAHIFPDGYVGQQRLNVPFFGRMRGFQLEFAQLALASGAPVHPVSATLAADGRVHIHIGPAFATGGDASNAIGLLEQYVTFLTEQWTARPEQALPGQMLAFLFLPRAPGSASTGLRPRDPEVAICHGLYSSGSTWLFNVIREIWRDVDGGEGLRTYFIESSADVPMDMLNGRFLAIKTHAPLESATGFVMPIISVCRGPVFISVRDPRDAVASLMRRFAMTFHEALERVGRSSDFLLQVIRLRAVVVFRYEDGFVASAASFDRVAAALEVNPRNGLREEVLARLSAPAVRARIRGLEAAGVFTEARSFDPMSHWHRNHVGDGAVGKFREILSPAQQQLVAWRTGEFNRRFGYATPDAALPPQLVVVTDIAYWRSDSLASESLRQWLETLQQTMPILVLLRSDHGLELAARSGETIRLIVDDAELTSALRGLTNPRLVFAFSDSQRSAAVRSAFCELPGSKVFQLELDSMDGPRLRPSHGESFDLAPYRYAAIARALDATRVQVLVAEPASDWDQLALACVRHVAQARGVELLETRCGPDASGHQAFWRATSERAAHPTVYVGRPGVAWAFYRHQLALQGTPFLLLSETLTLPAVRSASGAVSLLGSIERLFDSPEAPSSTPWAPALKSATIALSPA